MSTLAAFVFALLTVVLVAFQLALLFGVPWGEFTLGGRFRGKIPARMRAIPALSIVLLIGFAFVVAARAGVAFPEVQAASTRLVWGVVAFSALATMANAISPSRPERLLWLPVAVAMLISSLLVATA